MATWIPSARASLPLARSLIPHALVSPLSPFPSPLVYVEPLHSSHAFSLHRSEWSSADLTGRFPVKSVAGHEYLLIVLHHGYIHLVPLKNRSSVSYVSAYRDVISFFQSLSHPLSHLSLDNETLSDLTALFKSSNLTFEYVPPLNHRSLPAEQAIRTAKNHVISVLSSVHISFPHNRWPDLLPQAELSLNTLRSWKPDPSLSAWHGLHRVPFCFASHPIHPPGQLVVALDSPQTRKSWARHGTRGFYLSPSPNHYRCFNVFFPLTCSYRVCQSLSHFPDPLFPFESAEGASSIPDPTATEPPPFLIPLPPSHPYPSLTNHPVPTTVAVGTAGDPPLLATFVSS